MTRSALALFVFAASSVTVGCAASPADSDASSSEAVSSTSCSASGFRVKAGLFDDLHASVLRFDPATGIAGDLRVLKTADPNVELLLVDAANTASDTLYFNHGEADSLMSMIDRGHSQTTHGFGVTISFSSTLSGRLSCSHSVTAPVGPDGDVERPPMTSCSISGILTGCGLP